MIRTEGIVLSEMRYRDTSKILNIYTRKYGKIAVMARGAYRPKSIFIASTQPFSQNEYLFNGGRNFYYLNQASIIKSFYSIRENMDRFLYGSYMLELVEKSTPEEEASEKIYLLLLKGLEVLANLESGFRKFIISFCFKYISFIGYRPNLDFCTCCGGVYNKNIKFSYSEGGIICENCFLNDLKAKELDGYMVQCIKALLYSPMEELAAINISDKALKRLENIIEEYILYNIDRKDFNSLKVLKALK